jgi:glutaminyl-peptide cyclotransferase
LALAAGVAVTAVAASARATTAPAAPTTTQPNSGRATVSIVRSYPHDVTSFTEGLEVRGGTVYESSGLYQTSEIRQSSLRTGKVIKRVALEPTMFAEGMTLLPDGRVVQLTWKEKVAIVRDPKTLLETGRLPYDEEGWGLCYSTERKVFVHSDGTNVLRLRDPQTFEVLVAIPTKFSDNRTPTALNELECVGNTVYVNVWTTKTILQIDLTSGVVLRVIDASTIGPTETAAPDDVLNGIARLPNGNFLLTGKRWPRSYEVKFVNVPVKK